MDIIQLNGHDLPKWTEKYGKREVERSKTKLLYGHITLPNTKLTLPT